jgi:hypothetical protein
MIARTNSNVTGVAYEAGMRQDLVYVGEDNRIYDLNFRRVGSGFPWTQFDSIVLVQKQTKVTPPPPFTRLNGPRGGCPLAGFSFNFFNENFLVYIGDTNPDLVVQLIGLEFSDTLDLTEKTGTQGSRPAPESQLAAYAWQNQRSAHVIYVDSANHVRELYHPPEISATQWETNDLSVGTGYLGMDTPIRNSPLAGYAWENAGSEHVFYIAQDNTIRELRYSGNWTGNNLSQTPNAPPLIQNSPLAAYVQEFDNTQHVIYISNQGDIQELFASGGNSWTAGHPDLTQTTGTPKPAGNSALAGYSAEYEQSQHVIYVGTDGHIHELYNSGGWHTTDLNDSAGAPLPMDGTPLAGYAFENERTQHVIYIDSNGNVREVYRSGDSWGNGVISGSVNVTT